MTALGPRGKRMLASLEMHDKPLTEKDKPDAAARLKGCRPSRSTGNCPLYDRPAADAYFRITCCRGETSPPARGAATSGWAEHGPARMPS